jgi:hypothetical protein
MVFMGMVRTFLPEFLKRRSISRAGLGLQLQNEKTEDCERPSSRADSRSLTHIRENRATGFGMTSKSVVGPFEFFTAYVTTLKIEINRISMRRSVRAKDARIRPVSRRAKIRITGQPERGLSVTSKFIGTYLLLARHAGSAAVCHAAERYAAKAL